LGFIEYHIDEEKESIQAIAQAKPVKKKNSKKKKK